MIKVMAAALLSAQLLSPAFAGERTYGDLRGQCLGNYDGDTMTVTIPDVHPVLGDHISVRIRGIDTKELHGTTGQDHMLAILAKDLVQELCPAGSDVELRKVGRDKYFRIDATVVCGGVDVAKELVSKGLAKGGYEGGTKTNW